MIWGKWGSVMMISIPEEGKTGYIADFSILSFFLGKGRNRPSDSFFYPKGKLQTLHEIITRLCCRTMPRLLNSGGLDLYRNVNVYFL